MPKGPEKGIQNKIKKAVEETYPGSFLWKIHGGPFQNIGIPDFLGCILGVFVGIEVKVPGRGPSEHQFEMIKLIIKAGGIGFVATSPEEALQKLKEEFDARGYKKKATRNS